MASIACVRTLMTRASLLALVALSVLPTGASAALLQFVAPNNPSFWAASNWSPAVAPDSSAVVLLDSAFANPILFLGDTVSGPAQNGDVRQLRLESGDFTLSWEPAFAQASARAGMLNLLGNDPSDPGVGLRVGGAGSLTQLRLFSANTDPAKASAVVIGPGGDPSTAALLVLAGPIAPPPNPGLPGHPGTFHATSISLLGDFSSLAISRKQRVVAQSVSVGVAGAVTLGSQLHVSNGATLDAGLASFSGDVGNVMNVDAATVNGLLRGIGGATANVSYTNGARGAIAVEAQGGSQIEVSVTGAGSRLDVGPSTADASSRIRLSASSAAQLAVSNGTLEGVDVIASAATLSHGDLVVTRSSLELDAGSAIDSRFAALELEQSSLTVRTGSTAGIGGVLVRPSGSNVTLDGAGSTAATGMVGAVVGVGSDLTLPRIPGSSRTGGDLPSSQSARLDLRNGGVSSILGFGPYLWPTLAVGSQGIVTLDSTSAIYIGDASTPVLTAGKITLDRHANLWGTGLINGVSFTTGTHLDVLNTGGLLHPGFSPGKLTIGGSYTQQAGVLELSIGGSTPISGFSQLEASDGIAITGGTIRFVREAGYTGDLGAVLSFLLSPNGVVTVAPGVAIDDQTGLGLAFDFATGSARITQSVPEPAAVALLGVGAAALVARRMRPGAMGGPAISAHRPRPFGKSRPRAPREQHACGRGRARDQPGACSLAARGGSASRSRSRARPRSRGAARRAAARSGRTGRSSPSPAC